MRFVRLYSNKRAVFPDIQFNAGLNIVHAKVKRPLDQKVDSHNLGKTLLIDVLDFCLLKGVDKLHVFRRHEDRFHDFTFYLELLTNAGTYVTVRRLVKGKQAISILVSPTDYADARKLAEGLWTYSGLGVDAAREKLDAQLSLSALGDWSYRKGVSYFLRKQADYHDVFQISKFSAGKDREWKPYLAHVLGFDSGLLEQKYGIDEAIEELKNAKAALERKAGHSSDAFDRVKGLLELATNERDELAAKVESFDFYERDVRSIKRVVEDVESDIGALNEELYYSRQEAERIGEALQASETFDIDELEAFFKEAGFYFGDQIRKEYSDLVAFNTALHRDRRRRLESRRQALLQTIQRSEARLRASNQEREKLLATVRELDSFLKYKESHRQLVSKEGEIGRLSAELEQLDELGKIDRQILDLDAKGNEVVQLIRENVKLGSARYQQIREYFAQTLRAVLGVPALLSTTVNRNGNIEFEANFVADESSVESTGEGRGTTYRKMLCAAFDIAVLRSYARDSFFRFVYHDGVFESLDERKKVNLLNEIQRVCRLQGLQYVLTVIDADVPRGPDDRTVPFPDGSVIRQLDDSGDQGRLFRMPKF